MDGSLCPLRFSFIKQESQLFVAKRLKGFFPDNFSLVILQISEFRSVPNERMSTFLRCFKKRLMETKI